MPNPLNGLKLSQIIMVWLIIVKNVQISTIIEKQINWNLTLKTIKVIRTTYHPTLSSVRGQVAIIGEMFPARVRKILIIESSE